MADFLSHQPTARDSLPWHSSAIIAVSCPSKMNSRRLNIAIKRKWILPAIAAFHKHPDADDRATTGPRKNHYLRWLRLHAAAHDGEAALFNFGMVQACARKDNRHELMHANLGKNKFAGFPIQRHDSKQDSSLRSTVVSSSLAGSRAQPDIAHPSPGLIARAQADA